MVKEDSIEANRIDSHVQLAVHDIGGITAADVTLSSGVTLISGENASNKSSLLRALAGVLGGPTPRVKTDAGTGAVRLTIDGNEYYLDLAREGAETVVEGANRYSSARDLCELFVALTETNPIRQAVVAGDGLYDLLMRPVETEEIEAEIRRLSTEKQSLQDRLDDLETMENRLPSLRTRRETLRAELSEIEASLRENRTTIETIEAETELESEDPEATELSSKRSERNELRTRIRTHEEAIESLEGELEEVRGALSEVDPATSDTTLEELEAELEQLHHQKQQLTATINALSPIVEMNTQLLDDEAEVPEAMTSNDVVAELDPASRTLTCWTCGSTVEQAQIAEQVESVEAIVQEKREQREVVSERIGSLTDQQRERERRQEELERLRTRRTELTDELQDRRDTLADLRDERRAIESEIETLQARIDETSAEEERLAELYDEISDLEYERGQLTRDLEALDEEISELEVALSNRAEVDVRLEEVSTELQEHRRRIDDLEQDLVGTFNEMMQQVLDHLEYGSLERIWMERLSSGGPGSTETEFELHVVRATNDGTVYEDTADNLSKSEREVVGLIVALSGYLVHDVGEEVPFIVVDAFEMFDADRIEGLMDQFADHTEYVVASVLPEERSELEGAYDTVSTASFADS